MLNPQSPVPLYHQLAEILMSRIRSGEYAPGSKVPSENRLSEIYGIGRPTARQAIEMLVRKRLLVRKRGSGTFVRTIEQEVDLFSLAGTSAAFDREGIDVVSDVLGKTRLVKVRRDQENPFAGEQAYFFSRLTRVEGTPVLIEDLYLHPEIFAGIEKVELHGRSLSRIVEERYHMRPTGGKQNFRIGFAQEKRALRLKVSPTEPILEVKRFLNFPNAENAIYSELYCRTDRFVFSQIIGGMSDE